MIQAARLCVAILMGVSLSPLAVLIFATISMCSITMAPTQTESTPDAKPMPMIPAVVIQVPTRRPGSDCVFWFGCLLDDMFGIP